MSDRRFAAVPVRAFSDDRLTMTHLRVLGRLASHTDRNGWCRVRQQALGEAIGTTRQTVNTRLSDLVAWGYVDRRTSACAGRSIFYRVLLDTPTPDEAFSDGIDELDDAEVEACEHAIPETHTHARGDLGCRLEMTPPLQLDLGVSATADTRCQVQEATPGVGSEATPNRTPSLTPSSTPSPPTPASGGAGVGEEASPVQGQRGRREPQPVDLLLAAVATTPERAAVVDAVIGPIARQRQVSAPDPAFALGQIADWLIKLALTVDDAAAVVRTVCAARRAVVKPADIEDAIRERIASRKTSDGRVSLLPSDPACAAWLAHAEARRGDARLSKIAETIRKGYGAIVPTRWPPGHAAQDHGAAAVGEVAP